MRSTVHARFNSIHARALRLVVSLLPLLTLGASCPSNPCPGGVLHGSVGIKDDQVTWQPGGDSNERVGTTASSSIDGCTEITGAVEMSGKVSSLRIFDNVERIGGGILMIGMDGLEDFDGFPKLRSSPGGFVCVGGEFDLAPIKRMSGFNAVTDIGSLTWFGGCNLQEVTGFNALPEVKFLHINNTRVTELTGMKALKHAFDVSVTGNPQLQSVEFPQLTAVDEGMSVGAGLRFEAPRLATVGGAVGVASKCVLDLGSLVEARGGIGLGGARVLRLTALTSVTGDFDLIGTTLSDLGGIPALEQVTGDLRMERNLCLRSEQITQWVGDLQVSGDVFFDGNDDPLQCVDQRTLTCPSTY